MRVFLHGTLACVAPGRLELPNYFEGVDNQKIFQLVTMPYGRGGSRTLVYTIMFLKVQTCRIHNAVRCNGMSITPDWLKKPKVNHHIKQGASDFSSSPQFSQKIAIGENVYSHHYIFTNCRANVLVLQGAILHPFCKDQSLEESNFCDLNHRWQDSVVSCN